jgi:hypothetical protein
MDWKKMAKHIKWQINVLTKDIWYSQPYGFSIYFWLFQKVISPNFSKFNPLTIQWTKDPHIGLHKPHIGPTWVGNFWVTHHFIPYCMNLTPSWGVLSIWGESPHICSFWLHIDQIWGDIDRVWSETSVPRYGEPCRRPTINRKKICGSLVSCNLLNNH